jgi:hypothetical protein
MVLEDGVSGIRMNEMATEPALCKWQYRFKDHYVEVTGYTVSRFFLFQELYSYLSKPDYFIDYQAALQLQP